MTKIDRSKALILLSLVAFAAVIGSIIPTVYAAENGDAAGDGEEIGNDFAGKCGFGRGWSNRFARKLRFGRKGGRLGFIEVSEEFEENAVNIAKGDGDVQELLDDGYSVSGVRPIIKTRVEANGDVVTKATSAIVMLKGDEETPTSCASVWVDLEAGKVTKIVILTRTVIEKP